MHDIVFSTCRLLSRITIFGLFIFFGFKAVAFGQSTGNSEAYQLKPLRIEQDFEINGLLTNPIWNEAKAINIGHELRPIDTNPASVKTEVKVLYSDNYLYVAFWAHDPDPSKISAHISDRDQINNDDHLGIIIDTFGNNQYAYKLYMNPYGIQLDAKKSTNGGGGRFGRNNSFNMIWKSQGAITEWGYTAVMKVPFSSLHFPDKKVQEWSVNFIRKYPRNSSYEFTWTDVSTANPCSLCQSGRLTGMTGIESKNPINIIPYVLGFKSDVLNEPGNPASGLNSGSIDGRIGATILYSPTSTSTIDVTINPDFSQVETDATKIGANKTFALRYEEKRPFFLKKANLFKTDNNLFYSRTINQPWAAAKYTQTARRYSIGFLTAYDRNTVFIVPGLLGSNSIETDIATFDNVLRGKVNLGSQSFIGGLLSTRNEAEAYNYVGGIDWNFFLGGSYYFSGAAAYSNTKELNDTTLFNDQRRFGQSEYDAAFNGEQFGGILLNAQFQKQSRYYDFSFEYQSFAPTFQAQNGFVTRTDRRLLKTRHEWEYYPDTKLISNGSLSVDGTWRYNFANIFKEREVTLVWRNFMMARTSLTIRHTLLHDDTYRGYFFTKLYRTNFNVNSQPAKFISFNFRFETGRSIYRSLQPEMGHGYDLSASVTVKPLSKLKLKVDYDYSTLSSLDDSKKFYSGSISRLEGNYNFSRHLFFRLITQYDSFDEQIQIYPLLYYKLNPFTKFYIGMTGYREHLYQAGPPRIDEYKPIARQFFIKVQYLFRK